jgi:mannose/fructose/N-acetylgalactosamine-specific phosphotransferase system component IIB
LFTSDRAGLLFAGNLSVAVNSILKSNKKYIEAMQNNKSHSFKSFLLMKNPDETLKFPELILRIQNLVAFYMSFEYMELRTIVKSGK